MRYSSSNMSLIFGLFFLCSCSGLAAEISLPDSFSSLNPPKDARCSMVPEKGPCKALFWKYYYEGSSNSCREFMYGGCNGTVPFDTKEECDNFCVESASEMPVVKKPAIYLYPKKKSMINVTLRINGNITTTIPDYKDGWSITANPNGMIEGGYDYLFYEADLKKISLPKEGWVVAYTELNRWLDLNLAKLGLNAKEKRQFKEYWMNELPSAPYYKIQLLDTQFLSDNMTLTIIPKPDALLRLNFYFTPLQYSEILKEPLIKPFNRKGFTAVEWGGILNDSKSHNLR